MKFPTSFVSVLLLALSLPLLLATPNGARPNDPRRDAAPATIKTIYPTFTTIDVPGAGYTIAWAVNSVGKIVGNYGQDTIDDSHGFSYKNAKFRYFDYAAGKVTVPMGINDSGLIVGYAGQNPVVGFIYNGTTFTTLQDGSDGATYTSGINNSSEVVGGGGPSIYATQGFKMHGGHYKNVAFPGDYTYAFFNAVNNLGVAVGWTSTPDLGYVYQNGVFRSVAPPGADNAEALGINDSNIVVGWYDIGSQVYSFALRSGKYLSFGYPGAETFASGINGDGQVVGGYTFDSVTWHAFVTSPISIQDFQ